MPPIHELTPLIEEKMASLGLELFSIKQHQAGRHSVLRISIDKDGGVTVADCEHASHAISMLLDVEEFSASTYNLEVSSPGLDRPLVVEKDYRRIVGHDVKLQLSQPVAGVLVLIGTVQSCAEGQVVLQVKGKVVAVPLGQIKSGAIELKF